MHVLELLPRGCMLQSTSEVVVTSMSALCLICGLSEAHHNKKREVTARLSHQPTEEMEPETTK